jgi:hypothetical protein
MLETVVTKALYIIFGFGFLLFISVRGGAQADATQASLSAKPYPLSTFRLQQRNHTLTNTHTLPLSLSF